MSNDPITVEILYLGGLSGQIHCIAGTGEPEAKWKNALTPVNASLSGAPSHLGQTAQAARAVG